MSITRIDQGPRLSHGVVHGDIVYLAGQVSYGDSVTQQTHAVLGQIDALLAKAGTSKTKLLTATIWLADITDFAEMNVVYDAWVADIAPPTRCTGEVKLPDPLHKVEIIITAAL